MEKREITRERMEALIEEMKRLEADHPKATVLYDYENQRINITYPLPKDFLKVTDVKFHPRKYEF